METREKVRRLQAMLKNISPARRIDELPRPPRPAAEAAFLEAAGDMGATVDAGLQKLADNRLEEVTPAEMFQLEAIVMPQNRPVVFVRGASYDDIAEPWLSLNAAPVKSRIARLFPAIGRVELPFSPLIPYAGTGFVVGPGLVMTNRHVAQLFSQGLGLKIRYQAGGSAIDFKRQVDTPEEDRSGYLQVRGVEMIHPYWDMALLNVEGPSVENILPLSVKSPEELMDRNIVVVGYPARDDRNDLALQDRIFEGKYYVKRLQPGMIRTPAKIRSFENLVEAMTHDASTLGGNSGSAIIDVDSGQVVALHFAGEYLKANYAVPMFELARDSRVARLLNFQGTVPPTSKFERAWQRAEEEAASSTTQPPAQSSSGPTAPLQSPTPTGSSPSGGAPAAAIWTIPIQVQVSLGNPSVGVAAQAGSAVVGQRKAEDQAGVENVVIDQDYRTRPGYDPAFLEVVSVPLPLLSEEMRQDTAEVQLDARKDGNPFALAYYHYSVYMNKRRRTAWFSAANVDGDRRPNIGKRQGDRWYIDTRIARSEQIGQEAFEPGIDRGHLTRREDTAWGDDVQSALAANNDTFHFTNCSLQASAFNRGKDRWQGLEQFLLERHAKKDKRRMIVMTGPLFAANDPVYRNDKMNYTVRCPLQFWKVCVLIRQDGTTAATAFVLGQEEIKDLPGFEEAFDVAATQIKISDLAERTGLDFGELSQHDHFAEGGAPGTLEAIPGTTSATRRGRIIRDFADIMV